MNKRELQLIQAMVERSATDAVANAVNKTIPVVVNGKIDKLSEKLDEHIVQHADTSNDIKWIKRILGGIGVTGGLALATAIATKIV